MSNDELLLALKDILGQQKVATDELKTEYYRKGFRAGGGGALAVLFPDSLLTLWQVLKVCVEANAVIIMQAANTGLTAGSTPDNGDYDREVVIINTLRINNIVLLNGGEQVLGFAGATLYALEKKLKPLKRAPHSVIGSSSIGASIVGGVSNNSGGSLVKRGPAYTEMSLYARVNEKGELELVNHLGIDLGDSPEKIISSLENQNFSTDDLDDAGKLASDREYVDRIRDVDAVTPARFNADKRRLYEASGCAGKLAVFAVRLDTFEVAEKEQTFYIGTNDAQVLSKLRRHILSKFENVPDVGEYLHRDMFNIAEKYGKDTFLSIQYLGTDSLPKMFAMKSRVDAKLNKISFLPKFLTDHVMQFASRFWPQHLPKRLIQYRDKFEHHLILKMSDAGITEAEIFLKEFFGDTDTKGAETDTKSNGEFFVCTKDESDKAFLLRFAAAGAAIRYQTVKNKTVGEILALDIALRRNDLNWVENLPPEISNQIDSALYYGHFMCHVFHQDYILKKDANADEVKKAMLAVLDERGAKYPAEHNVGHLYEAEKDLKEFYRELDPTNTFNPGIGKMSKHKRNCSCCM